MDATSSIDITLAQNSEDSIVVKSDHGGNGDDKLTKLNRSDESAFFDYMPTTPNSSPAMPLGAQAPLLLPLYWPPTKQTAFQPVA